ncbi:hypothetical protein C1752_04485 [Acaryochloris thomasi RCC1774]|uniref:Uncharacterized protein n=2 Tax=Acaryochloris TaxID=155977 RepID=A0A2W1JNU9_9CYAN|nr:hypothetical protein C1752_04485 [Acaryochloris thomasi RCC1774]
MDFFGKDWLIQDSVLWTLLIFATLLTFIIPFVARYWKVNLLDLIVSPTKARDTICKMSQNQRKAHLWITATLDVAYPLSYGGLFAGAAMRFFPRGPYLVVPALLAIVMDLTEGGIQILALKSTYDFLDFKRYITPLKFGFAFLGLGLALIGFASELLRGVGS